MTDSARDIIEKTWVPEWQHHVGKEGAAAIDAALEQAGFVILSPERIDRENQIHESTLERAYDDGARQGYSEGKRDAS